MCCEQFFAHRKTLFLGKNQKRGHEWAMQPTGTANENVAELLTAEAQVLWQRLRDAGLIVADGYALAEGVSANQAAYIADRMAEKLHIKKKWKLFQQLWGIANLAQLAGTWQQTGKLPPRSSDIDKLTE